MIREIANYDGCQFVLALFGRTGYILGLYKDNPVNVCPCCMFPEHRKAIMATVREEQANGVMEGRARWVLYRSSMEQNGSDFSDYWTRFGFDSSLFCNCVMDAVPAELLAEVASHVK